MASRITAQYRGHAPEEYIEIETLDLPTQTTLDAALRLGTITTTQ